MMNNSSKTSNKMFSFIFASFTQTNRLSSSTTSRSSIYFATFLMAPATSMTISVVLHSLILEFGAHYFHSRRTALRQPSTRF